MSAPAFGFVVEYVDDIEAVMRFYVDVIGLEVQRTFPTFVQFEHFAIASDEPLTGVRERELYWLVDDAEKAFAALPPEAEVTLPLRRESYGTVFGVMGPARSACLLLQLAEDRPSQAVQQA